MTRRDGGLTSVSKTKLARKRISRGNFHTPSPQEVIEARTPAGAWTAAQLAEWGVSWPPLRGWREELRRRWLAEQDGREPPRMIRTQVETLAATLAPDDLYSVLLCMIEARSDALPTSPAGRERKALTDACAAYETVALAVPPPL
jgi:hypothetical protein